MRRIFPLVLAALLLTAAAAYAHHSYAATYDVGKEVKLEGKLIQFSYKNPHSYVTIQAPDPKGAVQRWSADGEPHAAFGWIQLGNPEWRSCRLKNSVYRCPFSSRLSCSWPASQAMRSVEAAAGQRLMPVRMLLSTLPATGSP